MELKDKLSKLEQSKIFVDWKKDNVDSYLAHIFRMLDDANKDMWQFGYYNKDDTITTFIMDGEKVNEVPEQEIFKKDKHKLEALDIDNIKIGFDEATEKANQLQQEKYKQHPIMKTIVILQKLPEGQVFNVTFVTKTFNTLNVRMDSSSGAVVKEKLTSLMEIAKFEKGGGDKKDQSYIG